MNFDDGVILEGNILCVFSIFDQWSQFKVMSHTCTCKDLWARLTSCV